MSAARLEIERKYLVERPDEYILAQHGARNMKLSRFTCPTGAGIPKESGD